MKRLSLVLLGPFQVRLDGAPLELLRRHKASALLAYLAVTAEVAHPREALAGLLWPGYPEASARSSLSQALFALRSALSDAGAPDVAAGLLTLSRADVRLNSAAFACDLAGFREHLARAERHRHPGATLCAECAGELRSALMLYGGDLLAGFTLGDSPEYEEWLVVARERSRRVATQAAGVLAAWMETAGDPERAVDDARRWVDLDPLDEAAQRCLMRSLTRSGRRSQALAQFEACRRLMRAELGVEPELATRELFERIRSGDPSLPRVTGAMPDREAPTRAVPPARHNIPAPVDSFVGRERELNEVQNLLRDPSVRLVTLAGAGGMGKTRLALEAARASLAEYPEGVWLADLSPLPAAPLSSAPSGYEAVRRTVALALGVRQDATEEGLMAALSARRLLLLVDNCEHVLGAVVPLVARLLGACPELTILATSREPLRVAGEHLYEVPSLALPPLEGPAEGTPSDEWSGRMLAYGAVRLLAERATAARYGATIDASTMAAAVAVCRHLDGMPLAIELAATRLSALTLDELARRLDTTPEQGRDGQRWTLLSAGSRSAHPRQRTLFNTVDWSYGLLDPREQHLYDRLGLFAGSFSLEGALAVSEGVCPESDAPLLLAALVDRSLVQRLSSDGGAQRFRLLETLRAYALERLEERGERECASTLHARYYVGLAERIEPVLRLGEPHFVQALRALDAERDNLSAAIRWSLTGSEGRSALRLVGAVEWWATHRNRLAEYQAWALSALDLTPEEAGEGALYRARALDLVAHYRYNWMLVDELQETIRAEQEAALRSESASAIAWSLFYEAKRAWMVYRDARAVGLLQSCLASAQECGEHGMAAHIAVELAALEPREGRLAALEEVLAHTPEGFKAFTCQVASGVAAEAGYLAQAETWMRQSTQLWAEMDNPRMVGSTTRDAAGHVMIQGRLEDAEALYAEGARLCRQGGDENGCIIALTGRCEALWLAGSPSALEAVRSLLREPFGFGPRRYGAINRLRIARVAFGLGERELALRLLAEATQGFPDATVQTLALEAHGWDALLNGDAAGAASAFRDVLAEARRSDSRPGIAEAAEHLAWALAEAGELEEATSLLAEAQSERAAMGMVLYPVEIPHHERAVALVARRAQ